MRVRSDRAGGAGRSKRLGIATATRASCSVHARRRIGRRHAVARGPVDTRRPAAEGDRRGVLEPEVLGLEVLHRQRSGRRQTRDYTVKIDAKHLWPGLRYWYRFKASPNDSRRNVTYSDVGHVQDRAIQVPQVERGVHLGRRLADTTRVDGANPFNNWEVLDRAREEDGDFFVYLGDTIYSDSSLRPDGPADTVQEYRDTYEEGRTYAALTELTEVDVDLSVDGRPRDRQRLRRQDRRPGPLRGRPAGLPRVDADPRDGLPHDPSCAGDPLYRTVRWGRDVELFITDQRSCRDADVAGDLRRRPRPDAAADSQRATFPFSAVPDAARRPRAAGGDQRSQPHDAGAGPEGEVQAGPR